MSFQVKDLLGSGIKIILATTIEQCKSQDWRAIARRSMTSAEIRAAVANRVPLALPSGFANGVVWFFTSNLDVKQWWVRQRCPSAQWMPYTYGGEAGWLMGFKHQGFSVFENYFGADAQTMLGKMFADIYDSAAEQRLINGIPIGAPDPRDYIVEDQPLIIDGLGVGYLFSDGGALPLDGCGALSPFSCVSSIIYRREWHRSDRIWAASWVV